MGSGAAINKRTIFAEWLFLPFGSRRKEDGVTDEPETRALFHKSHGGGVDLARLFEQLLPTIVVGLIVIYANSLVTKSQVEDVRVEVRELKDKYSLNNDKLIVLNERIASYLERQNTLNAAMDARMTYLERGVPRR